MLLRLSIALLASALSSASSFAQQSAEPVAPEEKSSFELPTGSADIVDREGTPVEPNPVSATEAEQSSGPGSTRRYDRSVIADINPPVVGSFDPALPDGGPGRDVRMESCPAVPKSMFSAGPVEARPGKTLMLAVSRRHLNRIVTPFAAPDALTSSQTHELVREGASLMLSLPPESCDPIGLFVFDRSGDPELAVNLTLFPQDVPQVEIRLVLPEELLQSVAEKSRNLSPEVEAPLWDYRTPHVDVLTTVMKQLALGEVPAGFSLKEIRGRQASSPVCALAGLAVVPRQLLDGGRVQVHVASVRNTSKVDIEIDEAACASTGVLAVGAWPDARLAPGAASELYVITELARDSVQRSRPSAVE